MQRTTKSHFWISSESEAQESAVLVFGANEETGRTEKQNYEFLLPLTCIIFKALSPPQKPKTKNTKIIARKIMSLIGEEAYDLVGKKYQH